MPQLTLTRENPLYALHVPQGYVGVAFSGQKLRHIWLWEPSLEALYRQVFQRPYPGTSPLGREVFLIEAPETWTERDYPPLRSSLERLMRYFSGEEVAFPAESWRLGDDVSAFRRRILETAAEIPYGTVMTYGELAARAGRPGAARAVGGAMGANPLPVVIPCHRVIASGGKIGGFGGGLDRKKTLLRLEGISYE